MNWKFRILPCLISYQMITDLTSTAEKEIFNAFHNKRGGWRLARWGWGGRRSLQRQFNQPKNLSAEKKHLWRNTSWTKTSWGERLLRRTPFEGNAYWGVWLSQSGFEHSPMTDRRKGLYKRGYVCKISHELKKQNYKINEKGTYNLGSGKLITIFFRKRDLRDNHWYPSKFRICWYVHKR